MKLTHIICYICCIYLAGHTLIPEKTAYQGLIKDKSNKPLLNTPITTRISILQGSQTGTPVYIEEHEINTGTSGFISLYIGEGTSYLGQYSSIPWEQGPLFLQIEYDINNQGSFVINSVSEILSVPYATLSKKAEQLINPIDYSEIQNTPNLQAFITTEADGSVTNEIQTISMSNDTIYLSQGGHVKLPAGQTPDWSIITNIPASLDMDTANEIQKITMSNDTLYLTQGGHVKLPAGQTPDWSIITNIPASLDTDATDDFSGNYADLNNKPILFDGKYTSLTGTPTLFSGNYNDLKNIPINIDTNSSDDFSGNYEDLNNKPVLFDGKYSSLTGKPTIFSGNYTDLTNKPELFDGKYTSLTGTPTLFSGNYMDLTNKPSLFDGKYSSLTAKPAIFSGDYSDLKNIPVNIDTNSSDDFSGNYEDLSNKPVLFDGKYNSLTGKPTIFSGNYMDLTNKPALFDGKYTSLTGTPTLFSGNYMDLTNKPSLFDGKYSSLTGVPDLNKYITTEKDSSVTNELQSLTFSGGVLELSQGGGSVTLPVLDSSMINIKGSLTFLGEGAGHTGGTVNTMLGYKAGKVSSSAKYNTGVGAYALQSLTSGEYNTALGNYALEKVTFGDKNTAVGYNAGIGFTNSDYVTAVGYYSGDILGSKGTYVGANISTLKSCTECTFIGYNSGSRSSNSFSNSTAIGVDARVTKGNQIRLGDNSITEIGGKVGWSNLSDGRFKENVQQDVPGLDFIEKLAPVTYSWNQEKLDAFKSMNTAKSEKDNKVYTGFIAQEVEKAAREINYSFSGINIPEDPENTMYTLNYSEFVVPLVKAVQEQQTQIEKQSQEIEELKALVKELLNK